LREHGNAVGLRVEAEDAHGAAGGVAEVGEQADRGGFACSVATEEAVDLSARDTEVEPVDCAEGAVVFVQGVGFDCEIVHCGVSSIAGSVAGLVALLVAVSSS
jgi:hypothetical protein